jgi:hypothetical protein
MRSIGDPNLGENLENHGENGTDEVSHRKTRARERTRYCIAAGSLLVKCEGVELQHAVLMALVDTLGLRL